jgi:thiol:disulfide interchange protein DsbD
MRLENRKRKQYLIALAVLLTTTLYVAGSLAQTSNQSAPSKGGAQATPNGAPAKKISAKQKKIRELVSFEVINPKPTPPGGVATFTIKGKLPPGYHTFPITKLGKGQDQRTEISFEPSAELRPLWPITEKTPAFHKEPSGDVLMELQDGFTWTQDVYVQPSAKPGEKTLQVNFNLQACNDLGCYGPADYPEPVLVKVTVQDAPPVPLDSETKKRLEITKPPSPEEVPVPKEFSNNNPAPNPGAQVPGKADNKQSPPGGAATDTGTARTKVDTSLLGLLGSAFLGAILMLLTPCVFPMIPITVNFFLKQSEKEHHNPLPTALVYSGTIVVLLTAAMLTLGTIVIVLANDPFFNLILGAALIFFALSLFGMYEIELPSGLARFTSSREGQGGYIGAVFMALTFTITSFTCTGPFLGAMMGPIAALKPPPIYLVLAALVYSVTFAAPFFVLALFPMLLKALPKSGGWLNAIKVTMGFLELGAALKFLSNTDIAFFPGDPKLFNYDTVLCAWIALCIACGLYLFGVFRLPHDDRAEHIGVVRMLFASIFLGLALYMFPLLRGEKPAGAIAEALISFLPPNFREVPSGATAKGGELPWHRDYLVAWNQAVKEGKLIFIDFTGVNCTNCRYNEKNVFPRAEVVSQLKNYVRVQLFVDTVPTKGLSLSEAKAQALRHEEWRDRFTGGDATNPTYMIFLPDPKNAFTEDGLIKGDAVAITDGAIYNVNSFVDFLKKPLDGKASATAMNTGLGWHRDYIAAWKQATSENKLMFLNFTGVNNTNCRYNEKLIFPQPVVAAKLQKLVKVELYIDVVPDNRLSTEEAKTQAERNRNWMELMNAEGYPSYVVFEPSQQQPLTKDGMPNGKTLAQYAGAIGDVPAFAQFLELSSVPTRVLKDAEAH